MVAPKLRLIAGVVLLPLHKPLDVAEQLATLDVMSDGKVVFGCGIGYREVEFQAFGTTLKQAGPRFEECLEAVKRLWTEDFVTMQGLAFHARRRELHGQAAAETNAAGLDRRQRRYRHPPCRAHGRRLVRQPAQQNRDAGTADGHLQARAGCLRQTLPRRVPDAARSFVARTRAEATRLARPSLEAKYQAYRAWGQDKVMPAEDHFDLAFDELVRDRFLFGSPAEVTEQILDLQRRFGVNHMVVGVHWTGMPASLALEQMQLLAEEVFPAVRTA